MLLTAIAARARIAGAALVALAAIGSAAADDIVQPKGMVREAVWVPFRESGGRTLRLDARLIRPITSGQYPLVLISHGSPRNKADAKTKTIDWADWIADDFARRGWIAATVLRRGYGHSEGTVSEGYGSCKRPHYAAAGLASAQDLLQTVNYLQSRPDVDPARVLLLGVSAGGFASIAAASLHPAGLVGVINFAGGRGSVSADNVCDPDDLVAAYGTYGRTVRVPSLWIYSRNDLFFGPDLAQRMFAAFRNSGAPGELILAPPYKQDGHSLIFGQAMWRDAVYGFLKQNGLPSTAPSLPPPPGGSAVEQAFANYLATPDYEKAFVIGRNGAFGWAAGYATPEQALNAAYRYCKNRCGTIYAQDDTLAADTAEAVTQSPSSAPAQPVSVTPEGGHITPLDGRLQQSPRHP
ncbi:MAG: acetylxylan esterase [Xanthobacteraceae bacterium]|nr:acetylxylan esterase [Xanthobacteraceae bacterium]